MATNNDKGFFQSSIYSVTQLGGRAVSGQPCQIPSIVRQQDSLTLEGLGEVGVLKKKKKKRKEKEKKEKKKRIKPNSDRVVGNTVPPTNPACCRIQYTQI